ncbi:MAG: DNA-directed RNA polymerase [Candidatus Diapherotrites archaeon]
MYAVCSVRDTVRVPPSDLGGSLRKAMLKLTRQTYEGLMDEDIGVVVTVLEVENIGEGRVIPGDGAVYVPADIKMLVYKPEMHEVVEGFVTEITEFGAFLRTGPVEGLIHVSQVMDDYINYDAKNKVLTGKQHKKKLGVGDDVFAKVVSISFKGNISNSKIGLTMRQEGLGKADWKKIDDKAVKIKEREIKSEKKPEKKDKSEGKK